MLTRLIPVLAVVFALGLLAAPAAPALAGAGGTFAAGGPVSIIVGLIAVAVIVLVIFRARRK